MDIDEKQTELVQVKASIVPKLNLSFYQNSIPVIHELIINANKKLLENVELKLYSEPQFFKQKVWRIKSVNTDTNYYISDLDISLDNTLLSLLTEAKLVQVNFVLIASDSEVCTLQIPLELMAHIQWGELIICPNLLLLLLNPMNLL